MSSDAPALQNIPIPKRPNFEPLDNLPCAVGDYVVIKDHCVLQDVYEVMATRWDPMLEDHVVLIRHFAGPNPNRFDRETDYNEHNRTMRWPIPNVRVIHPLEALAMQASA